MAHAIRHTSEFQTEDTTLRLDEDGQLIEDREGKILVECEDLEAFVKWLQEEIRRFKK